MKKLFLLTLVVCSASALIAQDSTATASGKKKKKDWSKVSLAGRANDHFMIQIGYNGWATNQSSINTKGVPRSFNFYFMLDFPFKTDPRYSVGLGAGLATDNTYFKNTYIDIAGLSTNTLVFKDVSNAEHFKKYKLMTTYLEAPIELRFSANPETPNKSWKFAIGGKFGLLTSASTKGKTLLSSSGATVASYTEKEKSKKFFNGTRLSGTARISYGVLGIYGAYQITNLVKDGAGPTINPFQIGISISGL
ncbi:MAG: outer membrane beta-barrel protein [Chitinophagaceae bacterium]